MAEETVPTDHVVDGSADESAAERGPAIEENIKSRSTWLRLVFMFVFYVLGSVAAFVASVVVVLGVLWILFTGETNDQLKRTGQGIATYIAQIIEYLTYNSDVRPFPFDAGWPSAQVADPED